MFPMVPASGMFIRASAPHSPAKSGKRAADDRPTVRRTGVTPGDAGPAACRSSSRPGAPRSAAAVWCTDRTAARSARMMLRSELEASTYALN